MHLRRETQFVSFDKSSQNQGDLAKELLAELPNQLVDYKFSNGKESIQISSKQLRYFYLFIIYNAVNIDTFYIQTLKKKYEKIELFFSARGLADLGVLSKSNPQCFVYLKEGAYGIEKLIGKTEVRKNNLNPDWKTTIVLDYIFEVNQYLRCVVMDSDEGDLNDNDTIGSLQTTVGQVMGSKIQVYGGELKHKDRNRGKLLIKAEKRKEIGGNNKVIFWQWYGEKIKNMDGWFGTSDPFLRFHKWHMNVDWLLVHETEFIKNNENPIWKAFQIQSLHAIFCLIFLHFSCLFPSQILNSTRKQIKKIILIKLISFQSKLL